MYPFLQLEQAPVSVLHAVLADWQLASQDNVGWQFPNRSAKYPVLQTEHMPVVVSQEVAVVAQFGLHLIANLQPPDEVRTYELLH